MKWTTISRYGARRDYSEHLGQLTVTCHEVQYQSISSTANDILSIDPDGGPYLGIGTTLYNGTWTIRKIVSHHHNRIKRRLTVVLDCVQ